MAESLQQKRESGIHRVIEEVFPTLHETDINILIIRCVNMLGQLKVYSADNNHGRNDSHIDDSKAWYVLTLAESLQAVRRVFRSVNDIRTQRGEPLVEYFLPVCQMKTVRSGRQIVVEQKMLFTYLFVRDTLAGIRQLREHIPGLRLLRHPDDRSGDNWRYMTVTNREMAMFRTIADAFAGNLPCYRIDDVNLEDGDRVQVVGGQFDGVEGILRCAPGRAGGQVLLIVGNLLIVSTGNIAPQYIRILEFGSGNRHPYRQFEAHLPRTVRALCRRLAGEAPDEADLAAMQVFTARFALLRPATVNLASSHAGLMLMSYAALDNRPRRDRWLAECEALLPQVTADQQRGLHLAMMHAATRRHDLATQLHRLIDAWQPIAPNQQKKLTIARMLTQFEAFD